MNIINKNYIIIIIIKKMYFLKYRYKYKNFIKIKE